MKQVQKLSLLLMAMTLASCNEKVSPELQEGNSTTPTSTSTPVPPTEYYFNVTNTSDTLLNYKVHKTGAGNASRKCEVRNTTGFSNDIFRGAPAANDITCFWEAEELTMFHGGWEFEIQASKNSCDYIGYMPFGFYDYMPGDSTATYWQMSCTTDETTQQRLDDAAAAITFNIQDNSGNNVGCGDYFIHEDTIAPGTRNKFQVSSDEELCAFNYTKSGGPNCDVGTITINEFAVTYTPETDTELASLKYEVIPRTIQCGGTIPNCVAGPTKIMDPATSRVTEISNTVVNKDFTKKYKYDGLVGKRDTLKIYANYRRNLSSKNIDFVSAATTPSGAFNTYKSTWSNPTYGKIFDPQVIDYYSSNLMLNNTDRIITTTRQRSEAIKDNTFYRKPLAADPFMGLSGYDDSTDEYFGGSRVNPYYTFYCFDKAFDIKARIRMMVREWDRVYPTDSADFELLSDIFRGTASRQDAPFYVELPDDNDSYIYMNDLWDWDDHIPMERSMGAYDPFSTIWRPIPVPGYADGWFNPNIFTNGDY